MTCWFSYLGLLVNLGLLANLVRYLGELVKSDWLVNLVSSYEIPKLKERIEYCQGNLGLLDHSDWLVNLDI